MGSCPLCGRALGRAGLPPPGTCLSSGRSLISRHFRPSLELCIPIPAARIPWVPPHSSPLIVLSLKSLIPLPGTPFLHSFALSTSFRCLLLQATLRPHLQSTLQTSPLLLYDDVCVWLPPLDCDPLEFRARHLFLYIYAVLLCNRCSGGE